MKAADTKPTYIVAVSGGIDSMVLLDQLVKAGEARLIVAHVDHGIRSDSHQDAELVRMVAARQGLIYEEVQLHLGASTDEASARHARYFWLKELYVKHHADALVTAHHQDDVLETIVINILRGTGWRGLTSLRSHRRLLRPLIDTSKAELVAYAIDHDLEWREDSTNDDPRYLRNAVRQLVIPRLQMSQRQSLVDLYKSQCEHEVEIEKELALVCEKAEQGNGLSRYWLIMIPPDVAMEVLAYHLGGRLQRPQLRAMLHFAKSAKQGAVYAVSDRVRLRVTAETLVVERG